MPLHTKIVYSNCLFGIIYLFYRGKISTIVAISSLSGLFPWHFIGLNIRGNALHFQRVHVDGSDKSAPWWFEGYFIGVPKRLQQQYLKESGRHICWRLNNVDKITFQGLLRWCSTIWTG